MVVVPYFLTLGLHLQRDLPALVSGLAKAHPGVEFTCGDPLDGHPALAEILADRAREAQKGWALYVQRYIENARRAIFFARYEANAFGSEYIDTHHLLLGVLRADPDLTRRPFKDEEAIAQLRRGFETRFPPNKDVPVSVDLPLSHESKRVLAYAAEEAERLVQKQLGLRHLLLGMLREDRCAAAEALRAHGVERKPVRDEAARSPERDSLFTREDLHRVVDELPETHLESAGLMLERLRMTPTVGHWSGHLSTGASYAGPHWPRVTEKVRRALFFARDEASQAGSPTIAMRLGFHRGARGGI